MEPILSTVNSMPDSILRTVGEHDADISTLKTNIAEIKANQKIILEYITEQKVGKKYIWLFLGVIAGVVAFIKDIVSAVFSHLNFH